jgi:hypothetical protein
MSGAIFETYILTEIIKHYWHNGLTALTHDFFACDKSSSYSISEKNISQIVVPSPGGEG